MVLPLVDEDKPKCFLCHDTFDDYEDLRKHQDTAHKDYFEYHEKKRCLYFLDFCDFSSSRAFCLPIFAKS